MDVKEKLVKLLSEIIDGGFKWHNYLYESGEQLNNDDIASFLIAHGITVQEWISVDDRLPDKKGAFLVYVKTKNKWGGYIKTTWFTSCYEGVEEDMQGKQVWYDYDSDWGDYEVRDVTHWMPLPGPPKGE